MIIRNGTVQFVTLENGGLDDNGYPTPPSKTYGEGVPCQYMPAKRDLQARANEEAVRELGFTILLEMSVHLRPTEMLRLSDRFGREIGEYSVISIEPLDAVQQVKILV